MGLKISFEVQNFKAVRLIGKEVVVGKKNPVPELYSFDNYANIKEDGNNIFTFGYFLPCKK